MFQILTWDDNVFNNNVLLDQACHGKLTINNIYYCRFKTRMMINTINSYPLTLTEPSHYIYETSL